MLCMRQGRASLKASIGQTHELAAEAGVEAVAVVFAKEQYLGILLQSARSGAADAECAVEAPWCAAVNATCVEYAPCG